MASPVTAPEMFVLEDRHDHLRIAAVFIIFVASLSGVLLPVTFGSRKEGLAFSLVKQIGSGVVLGTGIVHVLPNANTALSDPALGECAVAPRLSRPLPSVPSLNTAQAVFKLPAHGVQVRPATLLRSSSLR